MNLESLIQAAVGIGLVGYALVLIAQRLKLRMPWARPPPSGRRWTISVW